MSLCNGGSRVLGSMYHRANLGQSPEHYGNVGATYFQTPGGSVQITDPGQAPVPAGYSPAPTSFAPGYNPGSVYGGTVPAYYDGYSYQCQDGYISDGQGNCYPYGQPAYSYGQPFVPQVQQCPACPVCPSAAPLRRPPPRIVRR